MEVEDREKALLANVLSLIASSSNAWTHEMIQKGYKKVLGLDLPEPYNRSNEFDNFARRYPEEIEINNTTRIPTYDNKEKLAKIEANAPEGGNTKRPSRGNARAARRSYGGGIVNRGGSERNFGRGRGGYRSNESTNRMQRQPLHPSYNDDNYRYRRSTSPANYYGPPRSRDYPDDRRSLDRRSGSTNEEYFDSVEYIDKREGEGLHQSDISAKSDGVFGYNAQSSSSQYNEEGRRYDDYADNTANTDRRYWNDDDRDSSRRYEQDNGYRERNERYEGDRIHHHSSGDEYQDAPENYGNYSNGRYEEEYQPHHGQYNNGNDDRGRMDADRGGYGSSRGRGYYDDDECGSLRRQEDYERNTRGRQEALNPVPTPDDLRRTFGTTAPPSYSHVAASTIDHGAPPGLPARISPPINNDIQVPRLRKDKGGFGGSIPLDVRPADNQSHVVKPADGFGMAHPRVRQSVSPQDNGGARARPLNRTAFEPPPGLLRQERNDMRASVPRERAADLDEPPPGLPRLSETTMENIIEDIFIWFANNNKAMSEDDLQKICVKHLSRPIKMADIDEVIDRVVDQFSSELKKHKFENKQYILRRAISGSPDESDCFFSMETRIGHVVAKRVYDHCFTNGIEEFKTDDVMSVAIEAFPDPPKDWNDYIRIVLSTMYKHGKFFDVVSIADRIQGIAGSGTINKSIAVKIINTDGLPFNDRYGELCACRQMILPIFYRTLHPDTHEIMNVKEGKENGVPVYLTCTTNSRNLFWVRTIKGEEIYRSNFLKNVELRKTNRLFWRFGAAAMHVRGPVRERVHVNFMTPSETDQEASVDFIDTGLVDWVKIEDLYLLTGPAVTMPPLAIRCVVNGEDERTPQTLDDLEARLKLEKSVKISIKRRVKASAIRWREDLWDTEFDANTQETHTIVAGITQAGWAKE